VRHLTGQSRQQVSLLPESLDEFVAADAPVRVIDAFVNTLDLSALGFDKAVTKDTGRKPYHPGDLLKLYVYGYLNRVSTSRRLERECQRNVEVMWLLGRLAPDFKTIADFRKDNGLAIRGACRAFIEFCREAQLLSAAFVAIDGSKFKSASSIDGVITRKHLERDRKLIEEQVQTYLQRLDRADHEEPLETLEREHVEAALRKLGRRAERLERYELAMDEGNRNEHCDSEPEARLTLSGREGRLLGYNVQSAVEAESRLIVHHEVTNEPGDTRQLWPVAQGTKAALGVERLEVVADGGYANGEHLQLCDDAGITATVPRRVIPGSRAGLYQKADFDYDAERDLYRCPAGLELRHHARDQRRKLNIYQRTGCNQCPLQPHCTPSDTRSVTRHFFEAAYARSEVRLYAEPGLMRKRASIAERPFAVLKNVLGFKRFGCRGLRGARTEMSIAVLAYNLLQTMQRMGARRLMELMG
jgi:transposase